MQRPLQSFESEQYMVLKHMPGIAENMQRWERFFPCIGASSTRGVMAIYTSDSIHPYYGVPRDSVECDNSIGLFLQQYEEHRDITRYAEKSVSEDGAFFFVRLYRFHELKGLIDSLLETMKRIRDETDDGIEE